MLHYDTEVVVIGIVALIVALNIYFLPSIVATKRKHNNRLAINILNVFAGWTFVGWVIALIWACMNPVKMTIVEETKESE